MNKSLLPFTFCVFAFVTLFMSCQKETKNNSSTIELNASKTAVDALQKVDSLEISSKNILDADSVE
jgi:CHASE3 domain sensor protein